MAKNKVSEWSTTASNNTDIAGINIAEGCAPSGINNAIREIMAQVKDMQTGADGDGLVVGGAFTSSGGAVFSSGTTFSGSVVMSSTVSMSGNATLTGGTNTIGTTTSSTIFSGSVTQTSGSVLYLDAAATTASAPPLSWSGDTNTGIYRPAADTLALVTGGSDRLRVNSSGIVIIGTGEATTSVTGNLLRAPDASGTNISGSNIEIAAGNGTGTGGSGTIALKTAAAGSSGSTANTMTQRLLITKNGGFSFGSGATDYGTAGQVLKSNGDAPPSFGSVVTSGTAVSASGTSIDFTSIPSSAKRIIVLFSGVSTSGSSNYLIQLGSGSVETTGYASYMSFQGGSGNTTSGATSTAGLIFYNGGASYLINGSMTICLISGNAWVSSVVMGGTFINGNMSTTGAGNKTLSGAIDRIRITTVNGTDTFDAGTVNILYE